MTDERIDLVLRYIETAQRARASQDPADFAALRGFLADDVTIRMASPWTDAPWRVTHRGADAFVERLAAPINRATSLTTETVNAVRAGEDVLVEQVSTLAGVDGDRVSIVCHIFSIEGDVISGIRAYRNDAGLPPG